MSQKTAKYIESPTVAAIIPAHNEAEFISRTIKSLREQTYYLKYIVVVVNNSSDETLKICRRIQRVYGKSWLRIMRITKNPGKKAGAMNRAFRKINKDPSIDFVLGMDGDSVIHESLVEVAVDLLNINLHTGAVSTPCKALPLTELLPDQKPTIAQKLIWSLQNTEYTMWNSWRIENYNRNTRVLPGVATVFRMDTLREVLAHNIKRKMGNNVWNPDCLVEDFYLTVTIKELGWKAKTSIDMVAWSDVMINRKDLLNQRTRWYRGNIDVLRERGWKKHTRYEILSFGFMIIQFAFTLLMIGTLASFALTSTLPTVTPILFLPLVLIGRNVSRLLEHGRDNLTLFQFVLVVTILPIIIYELWKTTVYLRAARLSLMNTQKEWLSEPAKTGKRRASYGMDTALTDNM